MKKINYLLLSAALLTAVGLFAATGARADNPLFPPSNEVPRTCNLGTFATVVAGVDESGNPSSTAQFPKVITCPNSADSNCPVDFGGTGKYLRWDYAYAFSGSNPSLSLLTVSIDTPLLYTSPTAVISNSCDGDTSTRTAAHTCERKALRYTANSSTYKAFYLTPTGIGPLQATAGAKAGSKEGYCLMGGAGRPSEETGQAVTHVTARTPGCNYEFDVAPGAQDIVAGTMTTDNTDNCSIVEDSTPPEIDGKPTFNLHSGVLEPFPTVGSCIYTYTNTSGGKTQISCSTCCVQASTNTCVQKTSTTVCK